MLFEVYSKDDSDTAVTPQVVLDAVNEVLIPALERAVEQDNMHDNLIDISTNLETVGNNDEELHALMVSGDARALSAVSSMIDHMRIVRKVAEPGGEVITSIMQELEKDGHISIKGGVDDTDDDTMTFQDLLSQLGALVSDDEDEEDEEDEEDDETVR
jgi:hypothetical protein